MAEPARDRHRHRECPCRPGSSGALAGRRAVVTSGPTWEPIDPVRYIANRSSGKQGHAIAGALARHGAEVVLVTGPTHEPDPAHVSICRIETAREMLDACMAALPADIAVCAAAVADWRVREAAGEKLKKENGGPARAGARREPGHPPPARPSGEPPPAARGRLRRRDRQCRSRTPATNAGARAATGFSPTMSRPAPAPSAASSNTVHLIDEEDRVEDWPPTSKTEVAERLALRIADRFAARRMTARRSRSASSACPMRRACRHTHTPGSAGLDIAAAVAGDEPLELAPGARALVPTGLRLAVPEGWEAQIRPRSGLALRHGLMLPNSPGTIDSDYRGELQVIVLNAGSEPVRIERGMKIAQLVLHPAPRVAWRECAELDPTERGEGGFGSTGTV